MRSMARAQRRNQFTCHPRLVKGKTAKESVIMAAVVERESGMVQRRENTSRGDMGELAV